MSTLSQLSADPTARVLAGRTVVITGAASGIGAAAARRFAAEGARVALVARRADRLEHLADELQAGGTVALAVPADLTDGAAVARAAELVVSELGSVDVLVNNAGVMLPGPVDAQPLAEWEAMIAINLTGALRAIRVFTPALLAAAAAGRPADIVNVSSIGGHMVFPNYAVYGATKAGLTQLSAMLRAELGGRGVRVTDVQPGLTETELGTHVTDPAGRQLLESMFEQMTALRAEDVAEVVLHAISRPPHVNISTVTVVPTQQW